MSAIGHIKGEIYKLGTTQGIWPTHVEVNARIFDELVEECEAERMTPFVGPELKALHRTVTLVGERTVVVKRINPPEDEG